MELTSAIATVQLPERLDGGSVERLARELRAAIASSARIVSLTGATDDAFCLGLAFGAPGGTDDVSRDTQAFADVLLTLHQAPKPLLALIDGQTIGGGVGMAASCDWVIATERSTFALPELLWGLVPAIIWPVVSDRMAPHVARQWTLSGHTRPAVDAAAAGLVDEVVGLPSMASAATRAERMLGRLEPGALVLFREWARTSRTASLPDTLARGAAMTADLMQTPAARRRLAAFAAGEAPWT